MSLADQSLLASDSTFIGRVRESLGATCIAITTEAVTTAYHYPRAGLPTQILGNFIVQNNPDWAKLFAMTVATDANVISDATVGGTVVLTVANAPAQAALVTDAHINAAISSQF